MDLKYKKLFAIQFAKVRYLVPLDIYCIISKHGRQTSFPDGLTNVFSFFCNFAEFCPEIHCVWKPGSFISGSV